MPLRQHLQQQQSVFVRRVHRLIRSARSVPDTVAATINPSGHGTRRRGFVPFGIAHHRPIQRTPKSSTEILKPRVVISVTPQMGQMPGPSFRICARPLRPFPARAQLLGENALVSAFMERVRLPNNDAII